MEITESRSANDEIFRLSFELQALNQLLVHNNAERWVPGLMWPHVEAEHLARYRFALSYVKDKRVMDVACGCGYGSFLLATEGNATSVWAADIDPNVIKYAMIKYPHSKIEREVKNVFDINATSAFDVIVSFETIEHLPHPTEFLKLAHRSLTEDGLLLISTPIAAQTTERPHNPHHQIEWTLHDFQALIRKQFDIVACYVQSLEYKKSRLTRLIDRFLKRSGSTSPDPNLVQVDEVNVSNVYRGYQTLVCRKR